MSVQEIFIFAHGCYTNEPMPRNPNINYYFDTSENTCSQGDFTSPSWNKTSYTFPMTKKMEYHLTFYDELSDIAGFNTLGVYVMRGNDIIKIPLPDSMHWKMSQLMEYLFHERILYSNNRTNVYCRICRTPCEYEGGRRRRRRSSKKGRKRVRKTRRIKHS